MNIYAEISNLEKQNIPFVLTTVVKTDGSVPGKLGFKMIIKSDGSTTGTVGGGALETRVINESLERLKNLNSGITEYLLSDKAKNTESNLSVIPMTCSGKISIFYEVHSSLPNVYIFGYGHVGKALHYFLSPLNYHLTIIDDRPEFIDTNKNENKAEFIYSEYKSFSERYDFLPSSYFVMITHGHLSDYEVLKNLLTRNIPAEYIGVIGSKSKTTVMITKLKEEAGENINLSKLHMPVGLKIGGGTAEEIALSIAAEIQAVRYKNN